MVLFHYKMDSHNNAHHVLILIYIISFYISSTFFLLVSNSPYHITTYPLNILLMVQVYPINLYSIITQDHPHPPDYTLNNYSLTIQKINLLCLVQMDFYHNQIPHPYHYYSHPISNIFSLLLYSIQTHPPSY